MKALDLLYRGARSGSLTPIVLEGGETRGRLVHKEQEPPRRNLPGQSDPKSSGVAYAAKLRKMDDEAEVAEENKKQVQEGGKNRMMALEVASVTTQDTAPTGTKSLEEWSDIYRNYSFHDVDENPHFKNLLIHEFKACILDEIHKSNVVIIKGPTGCGKTTQVPLYILDDARERNAFCNILVTQPRRIAATSIAHRVCSQRNWPLGTIVGYQIALEKKTHPVDTRITFVTAGVLLQKLVAAQVNDYTHIIVDEVHERENETDFLLIILKKMIRAKGNQKKLILMSATMTTDKFVDYFTIKRPDVGKIEPPVVILPHERPFNVEITYLDKFLQDRNTVAQFDFDPACPTIDKALYQVAACLVRLCKTVESIRLYSSSGLDCGAVLIFLPGLVQIETMYKILDADMKTAGEKWEICELHSMASSEEQMKIFSRPPPPTRKIILATNMAESSITVPDVRFVIDFCLTKRIVKDQDATYSSLQLCWESKSQADQRAGRVGRTMAGRVYRLVPMQFYLECFEEDSPPEILRCPLDCLVLKAKQLDMGPPANVLGLAMDPPNLANIERTIVNLKELAALTVKVNGFYDVRDGVLTATGKIMAQLPLDTQLSKLIILGHVFGVLRECISIACLMSGKSVFASPTQKKMESYVAKMAYERGSKSDPLAAFALYEDWKSRKARGAFLRSGGISERTWANQHFAHLKVLYEVEKLEVEVVERLRRLGINQSRSARIEQNPKIVPLILKMCLAGACYPNYFVTDVIDEGEAVRTLGNLDPCKTVYFRNFPLNQPGVLYREQVKKLVQCCGSGVKVRFDASSKVFVEFEGSVDVNPVDDVPVPGRVLKALYKAVRLRLSDVPMNINILRNARQARDLVSELSSDQPVGPLSLASGKEGGEGCTDPVLLNRMPGLSVKRVSIVITHVVDPSNFYVSLDSTLSVATWIHNMINEQPLDDLDPSELAVGQLCIVPRREPGDELTQMYRAKILQLQQGMARVKLVDFGDIIRVEARCLKGFSSWLLAEKVHQEPPLALRCRLAEVMPISECGETPARWTGKAIECLSRFRNCHWNAQIYSIVSDTMAVYLYSQRPTHGLRTPVEESLNHLLVREGFARFIEEPYLSKLDHERREKNRSVDECSLYDDDVEGPLDKLSIMSLKNKVYFTTEHKLIGPLSPLELTLYPITRLCSKKSVTVEKSSINSILLNENPVEKSERLVIARSVSQSPQGMGLTLRNTTLMPALRGIAGLVMMLFAPCAELRVDPNVSRFTGVLCGLGCDKDGVSFYRDNDVELVFDCRFDMGDIEIINKFRFWMESILNMKPGADNHLSTEAGIAEVQERCLNYLISLLAKKRDLLIPTHFINKYEWNQVPADHVMQPSSCEAAVYQMILGVNLKKQPPGRENREMLKQKAFIDAILSSRLTLKEPITCLVCQVTLNNYNSLDFHVKTQYHQSRMAALVGEPSLKPLSAAPNKINITSDTPKL